MIISVADMIETPDGFRAFFHDSLPSTQLTARAAIEAGTAQDGDVVVAAEQTAGFGRRGRAWLNRSGNVYLTLTRFFTDDETALPGQYGFVTSLAIAATCRDYLQSSLATVTLKWPNDVLVGDTLSVGKIAGILLERAEQAGQTALLLGVGVNLVTPQDVDQPVAALDQYLAHDVAARDFILVFLRHFVKFERRLRESGFAAIRQDWLAQAKGQGETVTARLANGTILEGRFLDLDTHGALLLQTDDAIKTITAADIFFSL